MKMKRWLSCTLALAMLLGLMGCGGTSDEAPNDGSGSSEDEIVINYPTFQIGTNTAAPVVEELVSRFNEEYAGQYRIEVEMPIMLIEFKSKSLPANCLPWSTVADTACWT